MQFVAKEFVRPTQSANLVERHFIKVIPVNAQTGGNVIFDRIKPTMLVGSELDSSGFLIGEPLLIPLFNRKSNRGQQRLGINSVTNQGDHIHQLFATTLLHLVGFDGLVRKSKSFGIERMGRLLDRLRQFFDLIKPQSGPIGFGIQNLEGLDLVFVIVDETFEAGEHRLGLFLGSSIEAGTDQRVGGLLIDHLLQVPLGSQN